MRMKCFILAGMALAVAAAPAAAQTPSQTPAPPPQADPPLQQGLTEEQRWLASDTQIASVQARTIFPRRIGTLTASRTQEFSHPGEGIDDALWYRSSDGAVFATLYVYYPGLPHAGLAAFSTDQFVRTSAPATRVTTPMRLVAAGGVANGAIRIDYADYRGMASAAAFIKAGRWLVKVRISGPKARRAEVEQAMTALLQDMQFGVQNPWMAPHPLTVGDCSADAGRTAARPLADPPGAEIAAHAFLATFDGGGMLATVQGSGARRDLPPRIPDRLCRGTLRVGDRTFTLLRGEAGAPISVDGRTRLVAILNDNGAALEVVHAPNLGRYIVLYHEIGATSLLGGYDNVPSDAQLAEILGGGRTEANRVRVPVRFRPDRGPAIFLPPVAEPAGQSGAAPARPPSQ
jgi:hypothetical protein